VINIQQGISEAIKLGWPMGIAAGLQVAAQGAQLSVLSKVQLFRVKPMMVGIHYQVLVLTILKKVNV
jgi:hypothetical protein